MKKIYFASDLHLGVPDRLSSLEREKKFVQWLDQIAPQAQELYLMGDVFDFWFEYQKTVPRGYVRLLGKLAELTDGGLHVTLYAGNHDMWYRSYFPDELGIPVVFQPEIKTFFGKKYFLGHGDGLGPGDYGYKIMKKVIRNRMVHRLFSFIHPDVGMTMANQFSKTSRKANRQNIPKHYGEQEFLYQFAKSYLEKNAEIDYFVFGHRHYPEIVTMNPRSQLIVLGDWINDFSFLEVSANGPELKRFEK